MQKYRYSNIVALVLFTGTFILFPSLLFCQPNTVHFNDIYFEKLDIKEGLSNNVIKCIFQDHTGFLWFGTADGLNRYDGKAFKVFKNDPADPHSICGNIITGIAEDKKGLLWITTQDGGLCYYNRNQVSSRQFEQYKHDAGNPSSIPANNLNAVTTDNEGSAWVASENSGIFKIDSKTRKIRYISNKEKDTTTLRFTYGCDVLKTDYEGKIWCGSYGDLIFRLDPVSHTPKNYYHFESAKGVKLVRGGSVYCLLPDKNILWFAPRFGVLAKFNYTTNAFDQYQAEPQDVSKKTNDHWVAMEKDANGNIWIGSLKNGCYIFDTATKKFYNLRYDVFNPGSLSDNTVNCLFCDKTGILWVGSNKGICKYDPLTSQLVYHHIKDEKRPDLTKLNIYDFYEADNGSFWLATDAGLFVRDTNALDFTCKYPGFHNKPLIIYKFWKSSDGKVYLITNTSNFTYDRRKNSLSQIPFSLKSSNDINGLEYSYQNSVKTAVIADTTDIVYYHKPSGISTHFAYKDQTPEAIGLIRDTFKSCPVLWVGSMGWGLYQYFTLKNYCSIGVHYQGNGSATYISNNLVQSIIKDKNGDIWVATNGGGLNKIRNKSFYWSNFFYYLNEPSNPYSLSSNSISDMCLDKNGIFWITTYDGVLNRFDPNAKDKKYFTRISGTDDLSRQSMFSILCDSKNDLWIATASAILKYSIEENKFTSWKLKEQLPYDQFPGKKYIGKDGTIYFGGDKCYVSFHPGSLYTNSRIPEVAITAFRIFNKPADDLLLNNEVQLDHDQNFFTFEFASLNFSNPDQNKFAYKLDGVDKDWEQNGTKNWATYTSVPPGSYTFRVKASNNDDLWNETGLSVKVTILPAWWQTWWCRSGSLLLLAWLIFFATRYYFRQKLKLQQQQFEKQLAIENIRSKISGDIHDEIGSGLTKISLMSQRLKMNFKNKNVQDDALLEKITRSSKEIISNLGEIIWAVNPKHDNLPSLVAFLRNYAAQFFEDSSTLCFLDFSHDIPDRNIHPDVKRNLFLVIKEALHNIMKHAGATEVNIKFRYYGDKYYFEITDNGSGMEHLDGRDFGNGLLNMKSRMQNIEGNFELISGKNTGTTIKLEGVLDF